MVNLDIILCVALAVLLFASAGLSLHPMNKYSRQVKVLKAVPRVVLGLQFLVVPLLLDDISVHVQFSDLFTVSDEIRAIMWSLIILFSAEVVVQFLNVRYGRAEIDQ